MKRSAVLGAAIVAMMSSGVLADEPILATLAPPGQPIALGDLLRTTRIFGAWSLNCEILISTKKHLCAVEQGIVVGNQRALNWSIALSADNQPVIVLWESARTGGGDITLKLGQLSMSVRPPRCDDAGCTKIIPFDAALQAAMQQGLAFQFQYDGKQASATAQLAGLNEALAAAKTDPVGLVALTAQPKAGKAQKAKPSPKAKPPK